MQRRRAQKFPTCNFYFLTLKVKKGRGEALPSYSWFVHFLNASNSIKYSTDIHYGQQELHEPLSLPPVVYIGKDKNLGSLIYGIDRKLVH